MSDASFVLLPDRGVISVAGADTRTFLQGLVSNDVNRVSPTRAVHAALLTPQGKYLHDFFMVEGPDGALLLDCEKDRLPDLQKRLKLYKLRAKVDLADVSEAWAVAALVGTAATARAGLPAETGAAAAKDGGILYVDPRLADLGARALLPAGNARDVLAGLGLGESTRADYDRLRLSLGVPDGSRDLEVERSILLESGFDELNGVDWKKGCYMGQELTARTKYRGLIKKRLMPVEISGEAPPSGTPLMLDGREAGEMRSAAGSQGLALVRLEHLEGGAEPVFDAGGAKVTPRKPAWANF